MPTLRQTNIIIESEVEFKSNTELPMTQSNEPTIEAMNLAIVDFMEVEKDHHSYLTGGRFRTVYLFNGYWLPLRKLKYHTSWDWLMPVVEKIEMVDVKEGRLFRSAADVKIFYQSCIIEYLPDEESGDPCEDEITIQTQGEAKLEAVHKAVYQFITWYNQQTTTNE